MKIAGVDEAGRGPLAGPVVAAAVVLPEGFTHPHVQDSKKLSAKMRESMAALIQSVALQWAVVAVGHRRIDQLNIREATRRAMALAVQRIEADLVRIDGNVPIECAVQQQTVVGGDATHIEISAASILAKVFRDRIMGLLDQRYPGYEFALHAGYPTARHRALIAQQGPSPVHRVTFRGVREFLPPQQCSQPRGKASRAALEGVA